MSDNSQKDSEQCSFSFHVMLDAFEKFTHNGFSIIIVTVIVLDVLAFDRLSILGAEM